MVGVGLLVIVAFFDRPKRVAAPSKVGIHDLVDHIVLAEVHFISRDMFALIGEHFFCGIDHFVIGAVDEFLNGVALIFFGEQSVFVHIEDSRRISVAHAVFHENFVFETFVVLHVPKHAPAVFFEFFKADDFRVVENTESPVHIRHHIFGHVVYLAVFGLDCAEHRLDRVHNAWFDVAPIGVRNRIIRC